MPTERPTFESVLAQVEADSLMGYARIEGKLRQAGLTTDQIEIVLGELRGVVQESVKQAAIAHTMGLLRALDDVREVATAIAVAHGKAGKRDGVAAAEIVLDFCRGRRECEIEALREAGCPLPPGE